MADPRQTDAAYIEEMWGPRCDQYEEGCGCCDMWRMWGEIERLRREKQAAVDEGINALLERDAASRELEEARELLGHARTLANNHAACCEAEECSAGYSNCMELRARIDAWLGKGKPK